MRVPFNIVGRAKYFHSRFRNRLALLQANQPGDVIDALPQQIASAHHNRFTTLRGRKQTTISNPVGRQQRPLPSHTAVHGPAPNLRFVIGVEHRTCLGELPFATNEHLRIG
ncbi:MAG: hypothetical protein WDN03_07230 [Rhizomicrobium sp.]